MLKIKTLFLVLCLTFISAATVFASENGQVDWDSESVIVEGYGAAPGNPVNAAQAMSMARRAAVVDAYRNLSEEVYGVRITGDTTVKDSVVASDIVRTRVQGVIKNAKIIAEEVMENGAYHITMELPLYGSGNSVASAVLPSMNQNAKPEPLPVPDIKQAPTVTAEGGYTGLVVDCSGLGLSPMMSPVIKDVNGKPIYGYKNLDPKFVIEHGMAGYATTLDAATRVGNNPLVVKAVRLENHNGYPVVSVEDANKILAENQKSGFLANCNVVFLR